MRNLATIQRIVDITPIPGADKIEVAQVLGWQCVIAKSDGFGIGDWIIYIEIDSIVPDIPAFEFMRARKFRVRTIKLRGQISQGLIVPISFLTKQSVIFDEGQDVTDMLGIKKYDPQADAEQKILDEKEKIEKSRIKKFMMRNSFIRKIFFPSKSKGFPSFIKKTDEVRIQSIPNVCELYKGKYFVATEKLDGQSATYFVLRNPKKWQFWNKKYIFGVCSRNIYLKNPDNSSYWRIARNHNIEKLLVDIAKSYDCNYVILQGEIVGPGIQQNKYKLDNIEFFAFNLIDNKTSHSFYSMYNALMYHEASFKTVDNVYDDFQISDTVEKTVEKAKGKSTLNRDIHREGLVVRNSSEGISFKIINPDFLLKYEE